MYAGRTFGGSTSISGLAYERGHPFGYDEWAELTGDPSWRYENVLKYFLKAERYMGKYPLNGQHNPDGLDSVSRPSFAPGADIFLQAGAELGYGVGGDPNGPQKPGKTSQK